MPNAPRNFSRLVNKCCINQNIFSVERSRLSTDSFVLCCLFLFCDTLEVHGLFSIRPSLYGQSGAGCCYNVIGARRRASPFKVFEMWCTWATLLLVSSALVTADVGVSAVVAETTAAPITEQTTDAALVLADATSTETPEQDSAAAEARAAVATTRAPPRTLDRQAAELAWPSWLQSAESGNQNAPPRRITTKSLFIPPLNCPKGQRLDNIGCVQVVTVNKDEHERILLDQLNALFASPSSSDVLYDYSDVDLGPLQLTIPIGQDPQAAPLQNQEPSAQAQELQPNFVNIDKKTETTNTGSSIEAELELLKLQNTNNNNSTDASSVLNHNVMALQHQSDKPKRDSPVANSTQIEQNDDKLDEGQKEVVYGHVNVDPVLYNNQNAPQESPTPDSGKNKDEPLQTNDASVTFNVTADNKPNTTTSVSHSTELHKDKDQTKLNPENDYSDIGEAIKLISRYAEVSTDDNFSKDQKKHAIKDDSILGTRTKLQYRRNRPKGEILQEALPHRAAPQPTYEDKMPPNSFYPKTEAFYRYPWPNQHSPTPPTNYPFRHLQDYWPGRNHVGGVYNTHGNPRRHHHSYPHYFRPHGYYPEAYPGLQELYPEQYQAYPHKVVQRHTKPVRSQIDHGLYSLLGLKHWFSSESTSKR